MRAALVMALAVVWAGCQPTPDGRYVFDLDESKACVRQAVKEHPDEQDLEGETLAFMDTLKADLRIERNGTFRMSSVGVFKGKQLSENVSGSWTLRHSRLTFSVPGKDEMICDIDGKRLRCFKPMKFKLLQRYVMTKSG